jgi:hypothetical protein
MPKWCCEAFERLIQEAGEKGFSIVAHHDTSTDFRGFYLQGRPFERDVAGVFAEKDSKTVSVKWPELHDHKGQIVPWVTVIHFLLTCCPRCGSKLERIIRKNQVAFDALATKQVKYMQN